MTGIAEIVQKFTRTRSTEESVQLERLFKKESRLDHIPLKDAYFCPDCENVINSSTICPSCTNESGLMPMAKARW